MQTHIIDPFLWSTLIIYALSLSLTIYSHPDKARIYSLYLLIGAFILHTSALILRGILTHHSPMANLYETLVFFSWTVVLSNLVVIVRYGERELERFTIPIAVITLMVAQFSPKEAGPLPIVLNTWWFEIHVIASFAAYALFTLSFAGALNLFIKEDRDDTYLDICQRGMLWGFALFTFAMFSGGIWGYLAWGNYWLWEPKTIWSSILWFYYGGAIHLFYIKGFTHKRLAWGSVIGFIVLLFTYLGVGILMKSSHTMV